MGRDPFGGDWDPDKPRADMPAPLSETLSGLAQRRGWGERLEEARVHEVWEAAAGPELARSVRPVRLHGGVLVIEATSAAWATQVRYLAADLARRVNEELGAERVRQVRVVSGRGRRSSSA